MENLNIVIEKLKRLQNNHSYNIFIPSVWRDISNINQNLKVNFPSFLIEQITRILNLKSNFRQVATPNIYNLLVRYATAFDHNQDGKIQNADNSFKETGTFLKTIAILPYLKSLGTDVLYFLPITSIGKDGKKGDLGSPYSISNPYKLDENLDEPLLEIDIDIQFKALIEAAHYMGIKIINEFILRTASKDSSLAIEHPEWFYWINNNIPDKNDLNCDRDNFCYSAPCFSDSTLIDIKSKIQNNDFKDLPAPSLEYQQIFFEPPQKVELVNGKLLGTCKDGTIVRIPGAFADWPPDDIQPAWTDVTYLKLYNHKDFNYIAYNTIRMYDQALIQPEYETTDLWKHIENIIPYYQRKFGIDGVMIDMGHALPEKLLTQIIAKARENNSDFILWEENFVPNTDSLEQGFDLLLGYLPFDQHIAYKMREFIKTMELNGFPIPCFATPETHNTPRAAIRQGGINFSKIAYIVNKLLPLPTFIHSGFELGETLPVNTGLGFDNFDVKALSADKLPLFSTASLNWNSENSIVDFICTVNKILEMFLDDDDTIKTNNAIKLIDVQQDSIVAFERKTIKENNYLLFVSNYSEFNQVCEIDIYENYNFKCLLGEATVRREDKKMIFELSKYNFELLLITIIDK